VAQDIGIYVTDDIKYVKVIDVYSNTKLVVNVNVHIYNFRNCPH